MFAGPTEWVIVLVIILLLFGAKKIPHLAASLGRSIREFRKGVEVDAGEAGHAEPSD